MKVLKVSTLVSAAVFGLAASQASATEYSFGRGTAGNFAWNNSGSALSSGENAANATNGNWLLGNGNTSTGLPVAGFAAFPNVAGDIADIRSQTNAAQNLDLDQNITLGALNIGHDDPGSAVQPFIIQATSAGGTAFSLTFNNGSSAATFTHINNVGNQNSVTIDAPVLIGGNGTLIVANNTISATTISGSITSGLSSGVQTLEAGVPLIGSPAGALGVTVSGTISDGLSGGKLAVAVANNDPTQLTLPLLALSNANSYTGGTTVSAGTLNVTADGALGTGSVGLSGTGIMNESGSTLNNYIADTATFTIDDSTAAVDNLNYTGTDVVADLVINGVTEAAGTYGAIGNALAANQSAAFTGTITVAGVPEPTALSLLALGGFALVRRRRA